MPELRTSTGKELGKALVIATAGATLLTIFFPLHGFMERQAEQQAELNALQRETREKIEAMQKEVGALQLELAVLQTKVQAIKAWPAPDSK